MGTVNFLDFYDINAPKKVAKIIESIEKEDMLDEGLGDILKSIGSVAGNAVTSLAGKAGLAVLNNFSRTPKTTITLDFLTILVSLTPLKYGDIVGSMADAFSHGKTFGRRKTTRVTDLKQGVFIGLSNPKIEEALTKGLPGIAVQSTSPELYKSKVHKPEVYCYTTTPSGKISIFNMPKEGTDPNSQYDGKNRIYGIALNNGGNKAFLDIKAMPFKTWMTIQQITGKDAEYDKAKATQQKPIAVEINKDIYEKLIPRPEPTAAEKAETAATAVGPTPVVAGMPAPALAKV